MSGIDLSGKIALVTGASRGIGAVVAARLAEAGARVGVNYHASSEAATIVVDSINKAGGEAFLVGGDVSQEEKAEAVIKNLVEHFGGIDILINNAGITHRSAFADTDLAVFQRIMAVNYFGALNCTRHALPSLLARRGQVIVLSSLSSFAPLLNRSAYNASKHALHGLFETLRMEVREQGVNVMLVSPGFTATDIRKNALVGDGSVAQATTAMPFKVSAPAEVAEAIYRGACRRKRQLILSNVDWQARLIARFFPRLFERWMVPRLSGVKVRSQGE